VAPKVRGFASDGERIGQFYKTNNLAFEKCLEPTLSCKNSAIRAHSIQNARSLDFLVENGHVISVRAEIKNNAPDVRFAKVGRNSASTFTGFCAQHDADIFRPIDTQPFDDTNREHLFLLAYRSVTRELHANMRAAVQIQTAYRDRVDRGLDDENVPTVAGIMAVEQFAKSHEAYKYRAEGFDLPKARANDNLVHDVLTIAGQQPTIAVSSLFSLPNIEKKNGELVRCVLNVFPISPTETKVVFSYTNEDADDCRLFLQKILGSDAATRRYELSRLILRRVENFVLAPWFYNVWTEGKKAIVLKAFRDTIMTEDDVSHEPELSLF
jgi:hypothetical protein